MTDLAAWASMFDAVDVHVVRVQQRSPCLAKHLERFSGTRLQTHVGTANAVLVLRLAVSLEQLLYKRLAVPIHEFVSPSCRPYFRSRSKVRAQSG